MSDNRATDSELEEPEGFWPDEPRPDPVPYEVIPYTPDAPEFVPADEPVAAASADEADAYDIPDSREQQAVDDPYGTYPAQPNIDEPVEEPPAAQPDEGQYSWAVPIDHEPIPAADPVPEPQPHPTPVFDEASYAYHTTEEPVATQPQRELVDTRSWLDDSQEADQPTSDFTQDTGVEPNQWNVPPPPTPDPFGVDPFAPKPSEDYWVGQPAYSDPNAPVHYVAETPEENIRRSGLAWSAGIAFFGSVAFMLFLGWLADLLLGTSPWGMVGGIVLGSIIGFIQFFRISSQIYGTSRQSSEFRPLLNQADDDLVNENIDPPAAPPIL